MTVAGIEATGPRVIFEQRAPVGDTEADFDTASSTLFPHIYGGIRSDCVEALFPVRRDDKGTFTAIIGLNNH